MKREDLIRQIAARRSGNKYRAQRAGGHASKKEYRRAQELRMMERAHLIADLREQVPYELVPTQYREAGGKRTCAERSVKYVADFVYTDCETGETVVEDTKGCRTREYIIKRKLMLYKYGISIKEL